MCVVFLCYCPQEVREMVRGAYERAVTLLTENSSKLKEASTCTCVCVYDVCANYCTCTFLMHKWSGLTPAYGAVQCRYVQWTAITNLELHPPFVGSTNVLCKLKCVRY